ncbi:response regulator [Yinghuangia sp. KLBMP8922]|uniref:Circadian input-output histidine kinase CikA n=1 Tax=Yinghuangia soli TaxID=2908204 RepID=A0AA41Q0P6_9ACTN|nr:response regulator [Yinghuangia soli]MCF2527907.1 response regulator [Yinghuangia soli]
MGLRITADDPPAENSAVIGQRNEPPSGDADLRRLLAGLTSVRNGDFTTRLPVDGSGLVFDIAVVFNGMVDQLALFTSEVTRVASEVGTEGILGGQASVPSANGAWRDLTASVNSMASNLTGQVRSIAQIATAVAGGDLTRKIDADARGEILELKTTINAMVRSLRETTRANQDQDWLKTNLARFSALMQGRRDLEVVADLIMQELTPLVSAQHGAFFLAEETRSGTRLRMIGGYGCAVDGDPPRTFRLGQSLVGQAARAQRTIAVDDLPPGYVTISSGLGQAGPTSVLVLPIVVEEQVLGVIELAGFTPCTAIQRDFLDQLMESIGVNVYTILANARTDVLLAESQRLAAELQARSEELQIRQEELQISNAELEEKAALLATQKTDIEAKNLEIEQARQELEARAQQLATASRYKSEFLANMSHELRTPLNSLLILARMLAQNGERNLTPKQVEYADVIHSAGSDLLQLINDILDLSKVEAGKMDINCEPVQMRQLLDYLDATFRPLTAQKGLEFRVSADPALPAELFTDESRLRQVLCNLLSNAVKFTESGFVELRVELLDPSPAAAEGRVFGPALAFCVGDSGIGIADQHLETIFGAFQQADGTTSRKYGGTGLGLSISRDLAYLLGGRITAESEPYEGSVFTLQLPVVHPGIGDPGPDSGELSAFLLQQGFGPGSAAPYGKPADDEVLKGRKVLVVDDDARNAFAVTSILELHGMDVVCADNGREALDLLVRTGDIDAVLMDVMMPEMDGYAATAAIRADAAFTHLPIIAVTAKAMPGDRDKSLAAGATDHVTKPVDADELLDCIRRSIAGG